MYCSRVGRLLACIATVYGQAWWPVTVRKPLADTIERDMRRITLSFVPLLFAGGLILYKTRTSLAVLHGVWRTGVIASRPEVVSLAYAGAAVDALHRSINYFVVVWPALAFGILISAA